MPRGHRYTLLLLGLCVLLGSFSSARGELIRLEIHSREPYAGGKSFGEAGPYEVIRGLAHFAVDPASPANSMIVDLPLAPRGPNGLVTFAADVEMLVPADLSKANGTLLYDVNNRGNRVCLGQFNDGAEDFLFRRGVIVLWSGWISEVLPDGAKLRLHAPIAKNPDGSSIQGWVRAEIAPDSNADRHTVSHWAGMGSYVPNSSLMAGATLTWRRRASDPRQPIDRGLWKLQVQPASAEFSSAYPILPQVDLVLAGGLRAGCIYEVIYPTLDPIVQGLGLAGIRDLVSFLKYSAAEENPLLRAGSSAATRAIGFGVSQSGRCLRMLAYDGFNADESGRMVFDGLIPHVAGAGLGFFNHRFASPTRHNSQHDNHDYPADVFPFTYGREENPFTHQQDAILAKCRAQGSVPKVMHIQTSAEYWHRSGSLVHTDPLGTKDAELPPEVRVYAIGGAEHGPGNNAFPQEHGPGELADNPTDYRPLVRALFVAMERWISHGTPPPESVYPRIDAGTLVPWEKRQSGWRDLPGVQYPTVIQQPNCWNYGPEFATHRQITLHPPESLGEYRVLVPAYGPDNNERGMLLLPHVAVPLATYTGWNLRGLGMGGEGELWSLRGGLIPFSKADSADVDPRMSIQARYGSFEDYRRQFLAVTDALQAAGYLLEEDADRIRQASETLQVHFAP